MRGQLVVDVHISPSTYTTIDLHRYCVSPSSTAVPIAHQITYTATPLRHGLRRTGHPIQSSSDFFLIVGSTFGVFRFNPAPQLAVVWFGSFFSSLQLPAAGPLSLSLSLFPCLIGFIIGPTIDRDRTGNCRRSASDTQHHASTMVSSSY